MKKIALFIIAAMLVLSFFGCNEKSEKVVENEKAPVEENTGEAVDTTEEEINPFVIVEQPIDYDTTSTMGREFWVFVEGGKKPYTYQWVTMTDDGEKELDDATDGVEGSKTYLLFTSPTNEGTTKFKCYITDANGEKLESRVASLKYTVGVNPAAPPVEEKEPEFELVSSDGQYEFNVYTTEETVTLKVKVEYDGTESVDYRWYRCDEKGNTLKEFNYGNPLSMSEKLEVTGIPYEEMMIPRYYLASATIGNTTKTSKFSITLCPMGVEVEEPDWAETDEEFLLVSEDGNYEYTVYSPDEEVVLKVIPLDTSGKRYEFA